MLWCYLMLTRTPRSRRSQALHSVLPGSVVWLSQQQCLWAALSVGRSPCVQLQQGSRWVLLCLPACLSVCLPICVPVCLLVCLAFVLCYCHVSTVMTIHSVPSTAASVMTNFAAHVYTHTHSEAHTIPHSEHHHPPVLCALPGQRGVGA